MPQSTHVTLTGAVKGHRDINPNNPNRNIVTAYVPIEEASKLDLNLIPWVNPRIGYTNEAGADKSRVWKKLRDSLNENDGKFHERHRGGISLIANSASIDEGKLIVNFGTSVNRGLGDGGTTTRVISSMLRATEPWTQSKDKSKTQYVKVAVYCGDYGKDEVDAMVEAWNTNLQVDEFSMADHKREFDGIKAILSTKPNGKSFPEVAYHFGDQGEYSIEQVIQILCLFTMENAVNAYAGVSACLRFFQSEEGKERITKLLPLVFDLFKLYETIAAEIPELYNVTGKKGGGGKFMALKINKNAKHTTHLPFLNLDINYTPNKAWQLPMLAAFRGALRPLDEPGTAKWAVDPIALFREMGGVLLTSVAKTADNNETLSAVGRSMELYELLEGKVTIAAVKSAGTGRYQVAKSGI